jgi:hypothetical protein
VFRFLGIIDTSCMQPCVVMGLKLLSLSQQKFCMSIHFLGALFSVPHFLPLWKYIPPKIRTNIYTNIFIYLFEPQMWSIMEKVKILNICNKLSMTFNILNGNSSIMEIGTIYNILKLWLAICFMKLTILYSVHAY